MSKKNIFIIAGEVSGDIHGAGLMREIRKLSPDVVFTGIGGKEMISEGLNLISDNRELAVVGLIEILQHIKPISNAYLKTQKFLRENRPDLLILIDYPGFNMRIGMKAKKLGIKVFYYIAPQVWAWKEGRIKKLRKFVDKMAVILPFEEEYFKKHGLDAQYVGSPLKDSVRNFSETEKINFFKKNNINKNQTIISLLPGSRDGECKRIFPLLIDSAAIIKDKIADIQFIVPLAPNIEESFLLSIKDFKEKELDIKFVRDNTNLAISASSLCILASGTVSLETCLLGTPLIVTYKLSPLTSYIAKKLIKVPFVSLVNLIAGKEVVPELLLDKANPETISETAVSILNSPEKIMEMKKIFHEVTEKIGEKKASEEAAKIVISMLN
jgi:lipid-A-disaccharide synthase